MRLVLFTKEYPYGTRETYVEEELRVFSREFDEVIVLPYWIFSENDRRTTPANVRILGPKLKRLSVMAKLRREWECTRMFAHQLLFGRDKIRHLKRLKTFYIQLRTLYAWSETLANFLAILSEKDQKNVVLHDYWMHNGVIIGGMLRKRLNRKFQLSCQAHALDLYHSDLIKIQPMVDDFLPFEEVKLALSDRIFCISQHGQQFLKTKYPKRAHKIDLLRLGAIDAGEHYVNRKSESTHVLVSCSKLTENKRIHIIPEILTHLKTPFHWYHFGDGDMHITNLLIEAVRKHKIEQSFTLMGWTSNAAILKFYREHSVSFFLNVSRVEGIPVAMMEAASFSIPLLGTDTVGVPEIVSNSSGILVPVDFNPVECGKKLNYVLENRNELQKLQRGARKVFLERYNSETNYTHLSRMLKLRFTNNTFHHETEPLTNNLPNHATS
ncbi:MAG: glycosyltransferase [Flavobacteriales bacterium]|nr:MAG: glycosyltransferase [Flavobacteriales bacterium]